MTTNIWEAIETMEKFRFACTFTTTEPQFVMASWKRNSDYLGRVLEKWG